MTTTPAGWYDDGSGRQRWWDGEQWTENFAPPKVTPTETEAPDGVGVTAPDEPRAGERPAGAIFAAESRPSGHPAMVADDKPAADAPKKVSVPGLVGLGLSAIGTILVFIPLIGFIGFILLSLGFIVSVISLFLKGKKWPGIAGLVLAVVGAIFGAVMFFVFVFMATQNGSDEVENSASSSNSAEETNPGEIDNTDAGETNNTDPGEIDNTDETARPTNSEVAKGLEAILLATGGVDTTDEQLTCLAELLIVSDLDNTTLRTIAESNGILTDLDAANGFAEVLGDPENIVTCFV